MDVWIHRHLTWFIRTSYPLTGNITNAVLAAVTLIKFPGFRDEHHLILGVFNVNDAKRCTDDQWETFIKYRQFLAEFLTDQSRSGTLFVGATQYINLCKHLWAFLVYVPSSPRGVTSEK